MVIINKENTFLIWLKWHFLESPKIFVSIWKNYILFSINYFSLILLIKTFFSPWHKYKWDYPKVFDIAEFFNALISNFFSRIIGALIRLVLIFVGLIFFISILFVGLVLFLIWILIPFEFIAGILFFFFY